MRILLPIYGNEKKCCCNCVKFHEEGCKNIDLKFIHNSGCSFFKYAKFIYKEI